MGNQFISWYRRRTVSVARVDANCHEAVVMLSIFLGGVVVVESQGPKCGLQAY